MTDRYYSTYEPDKILYYSESERMLNDPDLVYIATSNCPDPRVLCAHLMKNNKVKSGYKVVDYDKK